MRDSTSRPALWLCAALCACPGDSTDTGEGGSESQTSPTETPTGDGGLGIGAPCSISTVIGPTVVADLGCRGGICVYPDDSVAPQGACAGDDECNAADPAAKRFRCEGDVCVLAQTHVLAASMCSQPCDVADDCVDIDGASACQNGFTCLAPGPSTSCCQRMCLCVDQVSAGWLDQVASECSEAMSTACPL